ncbi:MAG: GTPase ObgE [Clostridiales Family XIII bacterium]|jgi:GTP-binding protein|nr:GTPase ObgE [Clostridiales Family XIII bacterium]
MFVDRARITIKSGKGGNGAVSFRHEPFVPDGGPDGGDGGRGGDVVFVADGGLRTLMDFKYRKHYVAQNGQDGMRRKRFGKNGEDMIIKVPPGTLVIDEETGLLMKDLLQEGDRLVAVKGGRGGRGNVNFKTSVRQTPNFAEAGGTAAERRVVLELKLIADIGLVGFPNVGKSTLLAAATSANPKIGNYHFTTTAPNLGVVELYDTSYVMADIPGLIEGAHEGAGLGLEFLKHIERTKALVHVVDVSGIEGRDPYEDFNKINNEMKEFAGKLLQKPQLVAANKIDIVGQDSAEYVGFKEKVEALGYKVFPISAAARTGVSELLNAAAGELQRAELEQKEGGSALPEPEFFDLALLGREQDYRDIEIKIQDGVYELAGKQLHKIFDSTNFNDMGSIRYLYKYLEKRGAVGKLKDMGLKDGDTIRIKDFEFDYYDE